MNGPDAEPAGPKKARIEIIPLIDVIFFLLATFVLFTLSLQKTRLLEAQLPSGVDKPGSDDATAFIQASADGVVYWKVGSESPSEMITAAELAAKLEEYKRRFPVPRVLVRSDSQAKLRDAVKVLDEVHRARIKNVAIETKVTPSGSDPSNIEH